MDLIIDLEKRSGRLLGPFIALYSVERLALPDFVPDGTSVALLTPSGETLALALSQAHAVTLDTNTTQAAAYAAGLPVGRSLNAFVVVGDTDNLLATVPVLVVANALDSLAPPTQSAPHYPTSAELQAILNEMAELASAASKASEAVANDAQRVDRLVNVALPKAVEEIDTHLDERVRAAEKTIERAAVDASNTLSESATAASTALDGKVSAASTALDNKLAAVSTALDGKVSAANNAATAADGSAKAAKKARDDAEAAKGLAADSAKNAAKSAEQAEDAKTAIGDVGGRLKAVEKSVEKALPYSLKKYDYNVKAWLGQEESNILSVGGVVPAPVGFIATHGTKNPYAQREVVWIKPNGERITILTRAKNLAEHPWLNYNNTTPRTMWLDGDYVYIITTSNSVTYKTSIHFINGEPKDIVSVSVADADLTCHVSYSIKISDRFVLANNGEIFDAETLKVTGTVTLIADRLITASNAQGAYAMTSQGVVLISVDESGTPIITVKNTSKKYLPLANGKFVKGTFKSNKGWAKMFACEGGLSNSINDSIAGNIVPALMNADIGTFVVNPFALYEICSYGTSDGAVGYTMPIVRFPRSPKLYEMGNSSCTVKSGDAILINIIWNYILITKEELV